MHLYSLLFIFSLALLSLLFLFKSGVRKKLSQKFWVERLETIARDNQTLWSTHLPYSQKSQICSELKEMEKEQQKQGLILKIENEQDWHSESNLLKYPSIKRLFRKLLPQIIAYSKTLGLDTRLITLTAWAKISRKETQNPDQSYADALFSGCYYLQNDCAGSQKISFYKKNEQDQLLATFFPTDGDLYLYPSDMIYQYGTYEGEKEGIAIFFNVHFGNRRKSWLISEITDSEAIRKLDPFYETMAESHQPKKSPVEAKKEQTLFHVSKIK